MDIEIHSVDGKGDLDKECIWLRVTNDIPDLVYYQVGDTTYTDSGGISNELRHVYWFNPYAGVKSGDWIKLWTKPGANTTIANDKGTTTHVFYWNLSRTIWNKGKDQAVLFQIRTWTSKEV